jgi:succinoglycan biosynthesis transport protein ExoP
MTPEFHSVPGAGAPAAEHLLDYLRTLRRRWRLVVGLTVLVTGAALAASLTATKQYDATAKLLLSSEEPINQLIEPSAGSSIDPERDIDTQVALIKLETVAERVRRRLRLSTPASALLRQVTTDTESSSDIVSIRVRDRSPVWAARIANGFAGAYLAFRRSSARANLQEAARLARAQLAALSPEERATEQGSLLAARLRELEIAAALQTGGVEVVRRATVPTAPSRPRPVLSGTLGLLLGLGLGLVGALLLEFADRRIKDEDAVEQTFGLPVLATVPRPARRSRGGAADASQEREAYGLLAANIRFSLGTGESGTLMITSPGAEEGKTSVALGLSRALTLLGQRVITIEADLRRPSFGKFIELPPSQGLPAVLSGNVSLSEELIWVHAPDMRMVTLDSVGDQASFALLRAGKPPANPQALLARPAMAELVAEARSLADVVLFDTAPVGAVNDPVALAPLVDEVLLVARLNRTTKDGVRRALRALRNLDVRVPGVVVTDAPAGAASYYHYGVDERAGRRKRDSEVGAT